MTRHGWSWRRRLARRYGRVVIGYLLAGCALALAGMIWISNHWLEPACLWCATFEHEE